MKFGHIEREGNAVGFFLEVHAPDACQEGQRAEDGGEHRENPHDFVGANPDGRQVKLHEARDRVAVCLDEIHDLYGVVVAVTEEHLGFTADESAFVVKEGIDDIALGPDEAAELGEGLLAPVKAVDVVGRWFADDDAIEFFDVVAEAFEDRKMIVDDGVGECVREMVGSAFSDEAACVADAVADGGERVSQRLFLNGEDEVGAEENGDLLDTKFVRLVEVNHLKDDKKVAFVRLNFRALTGMLRVFDGERVQVEAGGQLTEECAVTNPVQLHPEDGAIRCWRNLVNCRNDFLFEARWIVDRESEHGLDLRCGLGWRRSVFGSGNARALFSEPAEKHVNRFRRGNVCRLLDCGLMRRLRPRYRF